MARSFITPSMRKLILVLICVVSSLAWADAMSSRLLVVVGILKEAKLAQGKNVTLLVSGANSARLAESLEKESFVGVRAVISFGVAGGLNPEYGTADVIIPDTIVKDGRIWFTDPGLNEKFRAQLGGLGLVVRDGILAGSSEVITTAAGKAELYRTLNADAVDMESHVAAEFALKHRVPFAAIRVISDPADRSLPEAALNAVSADGDVKLIPILMSVLRDFSQMGKLLRAGLDSRKAFETLAQCQVLLGG